MVTVKLNFRPFAASLKTKLEQLNNPEILLRPVALAMLPIVQRRIHVDGQASDAGAIGSYKKSYLKLRESAKYNRQEGSKVVISLTRQLENDYNVVATEKGYGWGFKNPLNQDKAEWVTEHFGKKIFPLTVDETKQAVGLIEEVANKILQS